MYRSKSSLFGFNYQQQCWMCLLLFFLLLQSCATYEIQKTEAFDQNAGWVRLPFVNNSDTPEAGDRAAEIAATLLRTHGIVGLVKYQPQVTNSQTMPELNQQQDQIAAIDWAKGQGYRYGFGGSVQEWRYKSGLDAEPAVGVTLTVTDLSNNRIVWSASGSKTGWGRDSVSGVGQKLIRTLVNGLPLTD